MIAGFTDVSEIINLLDFDFAAATLGYQKNGTSGMLTISDGVDTATLNLVGQYTAASFNMASNGAGGTLVWDRLSSCKTRGKISVPEIG